MAEGEQRLLRQEEELEELRQTNSNLEDRVDRMSIQIASPNPQNQSLFEELDMSSGTRVKSCSNILEQKNSNTNFESERNITLVWLFAIQTFIFVKKVPSALQRI